MANPAAPSESGGRKIPFSSDPANTGTPYLVLGRGDVDMGGGNTKGAHATVLAPSSTAARTSVAGAASSTTLLAANVKRVGATFYNDSAAILYLALGTATATTSDYTVQVAASGFYELPFGYDGIVKGIWASATGNCRVTELAHA